jgi:hypothetical protein
MTNINYKRANPGKDDALDKKIDETNEQLNSNLKLHGFQCKTYGKSKFSSTISFACDECNLPLQLYGENYIETYTDGKVNVLRALCDLHADEFELEVQL